MYAQVTGEKVVLKSDDGVPTAVSPNATWNIK
jgi:hypothetical protein